MGKMTKRSLVLVAAALLTVVAGQAQAATRFAVQNQDGTKDMMVVTDSGNIGVGNDNPGMAIVVDRAGNTGETSMMFRNRGGLTHNLYDTPSFFFMKNNPSNTNGTLPVNGDRLGSISFGSVLTTGGLKYGANIAAFSQGSWSSSSSPGYLVFSTTGTATTDTGAVERVRIDSQKLEVRAGIKLAAPPATVVKPACDTANGPTNRGTMWFTRNTTGADTLEVCAKDANGNYSWVNLML